MDQSEEAISNADFTVVPDDKLGDFVLQKDGEGLVYLNVEFRHHSSELLENIASELRATGRFQFPPEPQQFSYATLFISAAKKLELKDDSWFTPLFFDPILISDISLEADRVDRWRQTATALEKQWRSGTRTKKRYITKE